ncbi:hypothetical protein VTK73DRAFT_7560 [Phialemonium thermophilum]|uniref:Uncharacterized protein n=1 Tax=Phialemonium thermophilum TaxID=223376 RepID=A0ABR3XT87_9PEZI
MIGQFVTGWQPMAAMLNRDGGQNPRFERRFYPWDPSPLPVPASASALLTELPHKLASTLPLYLHQEKFCGESGRQQNAVVLAALCRSGHWRLKMNAIHEVGTHPPIPPSSMMSPRWRRRFSNVRHRWQLASNRTLSKLHLRTGEQNTILANRQG